MRGTSSRARRLGTAALALTLVAAPVARADDVLRIPALPAAAPPDAKTAQRGLAAYARAQRAWRRHQYPAALSAAREAFEAVPNASTALIVVTVLVALERRCDALDLLLVAAELDAAPEEASAVRAGLAREAAACGAGYGWLRVESDPASVTARLDGAEIPIGRTLAVLAGVRRLELEAPGYTSREKRLDCQAGVGAEVHLDLVPLPPSVPVTAPAPSAPSAPLVVPEPRIPEREGGEVGQRALGWSLTGGGLGGLAVAGLLAGLAVDSAQTASDLSSTPGRRDDYEAAADRARALEASAWTLGGVGLGALIGGIVVLSLDADAFVSVAPEAAGARLVVGGSF